MTVKSRAVSYVDKLFSNLVQEQATAVAAGTYDDADDDYALNLLKQDAKDNLDLVQLMSRAVDPNTGIPKDLTIPDGDFNEAPNYFTYCRKFLGKDTKFPFARQMWIMSMLFNEVCPRCSDKKFLNLKGVPVDYPSKELPERLVFLKFGKCPKCGARRSDLIKSHELDFRTELSLEAGQRSGKSTITASGLSYITHKYLKGPRLSTVCEGISTSTILTGTVIGYRFADAYALLWQPFTECIVNSPWFRDYHSMLTEVGSRMGVELFRLKDSFLRYGFKGLEFYPAGPSKRGLRGRTRLVCLTGDTLVNTDSGLIEIQDPSVVEKVTFAGNRSRKIINWWDNGERETVKLTLENGLTLTGTPDHRVAVYSSVATNGLEWKELHQLDYEDHVVCSLGGSFPESLTLPWVYSRKLTRLELVADYIQQSESFTIDNLFDLGCFSSRNAVTAVTSKLRRQGYVTRKKRAAADGVFDYYKTGKPLRTLKRRVGKIQKKKDKIVYPTKMTPELAAILGYLVADGNYVLNHYEIGFGSTSKEKVDHYSKCLRKVFNFTPRRHEGINKQGRHAYSACIGHAPIKEFFQKIGLGKHTSRYKEVPWSIMQSPRDCAIAFLSAAISCDGHLGKKTSYSSTSKTLLSGFQQLFFKLGYPCHINWRDGCGSVILAPYTSNLWKREYVGLQKRPWREDDRETHELTKSLAYDEYRIPRSSYYLDGCNKYRHTVSSLDYVKDAVSPCQLKDSGIVFSKVKKIKSAGVQRVFDIEVDSEDHAFAANGIMTHNCATDEIGWFPLEGEGDDRERAGAEEVYKALDRSLLTVRTEVETLYSKGFDNFLPGIAFNISSPSSQTDMIHRLVHEKKSPNNLGVQLATWDINPLYSRDSSMIVKAYQDDPVAAERDYGANPPISSKPFVPIDTVTPCFKLKTNRLGLSSVEREISGSVYVGGHIDFKNPYTPTPASVLAIDAGATKNSFAFAIGHNEETVAVIDALGEIQPRKGTAGIHYNQVYKKVIEEIITAFNVTWMFADRWNSYAHLHRASEEKKIQALQYSVKYSDFMLFRSYLQAGKILLPTSEIPIEQVASVTEYPQYFENRPVAHLIFQLMTVKDKGNMVVKGDRYTDDILRASVLLLAKLKDEKVSDSLAAASRQSVMMLNQQRVGMLAVGRSVGVAGSVEFNVRHQLQQTLQVQDKTGVSARPTPAPITVVSRGFRR